MTTAEARRNKRRRYVVGFPREAKFLTTEEVVEYLSGDRIQCLICGRKLKAMTSHLASIHSVDEIYYKERFGIPWTYPLASTESSKAYRDNALRRTNTEELRERTLRARKIKATEGEVRKLIQPAIKKQRVDRFSALRSVSVDSKCCVCGAEVKTTAIVGRKRCRACIIKQNRLDHKTKDELGLTGKQRIAQWAADNPERYRKYNNARQRLFHGNPVPAQEYEKEYGVELRALKSFFSKAIN